MNCIKFMSTTFNITATMPIVLDDYLKMTETTAYEQRATNIDSKLKPLVNKQIKGMKDTIEWVLPTVKVPGKPLFGFISRNTTVPVQVKSWKVTWNPNNGVGYFNFKWEAITEKDVKIDVNSVKDALAWGIADGWGSSAVQSSRFGELCLFDEEIDKFRRALPEEKKGLDETEFGRYALLLTLKGAKITVTN